MELLVALTILVIAILPIAFFYGKMLRGIEEASIRTRALELAQERIAELKQVPPDQIRANNTPSKGDIIAGGLDLTMANYYYDPGPPFRSFQYYYPLPVLFNPYDPKTQGWDNSPTANHYDPASTVYEYEPIGFLSRIPATSDAATSDPRRNPIVDNPDRAPGGFVARGGGPVEIPRVGSEQREEKFEIYGRRTVILEVVPYPPDDDTDALLPDDPLDGGATIYDPYPATRGPANKYQARSKDGGYGYKGWVTVFWLPNNAPETYLQLKDLNYVQIPFYISLTNAESNLTVDDKRVSLSNRFVIS
ncbi:MAG: hypothetical protein HRF49_03920 [bacterium]|jgi:hypothetical protein